MHASPIRVGAPALPHTVWPMARTGILVIVVVAACIVPANAKEPRIGAGQEGDFLVPGCEHPCKLYVPRDYKAGPRWPLLIFLHGSGGKPTSWPWKTATNGEGYLIAGLCYGAFDDGGAGGILSDPASCEAMIAFIDKARAWIDEHYGVDQQAVFLTGLSMGGWGTNFYGFHEKARGRYRGYAILAAGPRSGVDHSVAQGLPVMLLNGSEDQNLAAANQGKPLLEKAGAIVTQVVLEGEPHVPSVASMAKPLRTWLEHIRKDDDREKAIAAVRWQDVPLGTAPGKADDLPTYLAAHAGVASADPNKPVLVFFVSRAIGRKDKPTKAAAASETALRTLFTYPHALGPPSAARFFTCLRMDVSHLERKQSPRVHEGTAPLLALLGTDRSQATLLAKGKLKPIAVTAALRAHLTEPQRQDTDARVARITPVLAGLAKLFKARGKLAKSLRMLRRKGPSKKLKAKEKELEGLDGQIEALRDQLADPTEEVDREDE